IPLPVNIFTNYHVKLRCEDRYHSRELPEGPRRWTSSPCIFGRGRSQVTVGHRSLLSPAKTIKLTGSVIWLTTALLPQILAMQKQTNEPKPTGSVCSAPQEQNTGKLQQQLHNKISSLVSVLEESPRAILRVCGLHRRGRETFSLLRPLGTVSGILPNLQGPSLSTRKRSLGDGKLESRTAFSSLLIGYLEFTPSRKSMYSKFSCIFLKEYQCDSQLPQSSMHWRSGKERGSHVAVLRRRLCGSLSVPVVLLKWVMQGKKNTTEYRACKTRTANHTQLSQFMCSAKYTCFCTPV
ncbi:Hypothetical predicted protein, partial [Podarcis lilfordi]